MNRQSINKAQKSNAAALESSGLLQRKTVNKTDIGSSMADTQKPAGFVAADTVFNHDLSTIPVSPMRQSLLIQAKLKIGQPNDKFEQEADRVAEQVMRMPNPQPGSSANNIRLTNHNETIQRACASCSAEYKTAEEESRAVYPANFCPQCQNNSQDIIQRKPSTPVIQAKTSAIVTPDVSPEINAGIQSLQGGGQPLSASERGFFEPRFGADFSQVRIHSDTKADAVSRSINARAFAFGSSIAFRQGEYQPATHSGRMLLAHELTHTLQQSGGNSEKLAQEKNTVDGFDSISTLTTGVPQLQRLLSEAAIEVAVQNAPRVVLLFEEYAVIIEAGIVTAEEIAVVTASVAEAELAVAAAAEMAAAGSTATIIGEGALVASAGLAADDVTGIGVADDVAIPFTLIAAGIGIGIGAGIAYYFRDEIAATARAAIDAVAEVIQLLREVVRRYRPPFSDLPGPEIETQPRPVAETRPDSQTRPRPISRPDVDVDIDDDTDERTGCRYQVIGQQFGRYPCHADYASSLSGVSREVRITTPEGFSVAFDAMDHGGHLYEVKTGYRWLPFNNIGGRRASIISQFYNQAANQILVAERCDHTLSWHFNEDVAASYFYANNARTDYNTVPMPVDVWYNPFDCNRDSD